MCNITPVMIRTPPAIGIVLSIALLPYLVRRATQRLHCSHDPARV
ncbi:MAG TPA: hypothetical protein VJ698_03340 [Noviherbaspirillum sp.]|nr:hypothetical protein [Noviherbaspirillum sp.]HJV84485.1 hypothetical protein [Noviherbaspirillum sp.]